MIKRSIAAISRRIERAKYECRWWRWLVGALDLDRFVHDSETYNILLRRFAATEPDFEGHYPKREKYMRDMKRRTFGKAMTAGALSGLMLPGIDLGQFGIQSSVICSRKLSDGTRCTHKGKWQPVLLLQGEGKAAMPIALTMALCPDCTLKAGVPDFITGSNLWPQIEKLFAKIGRMPPMKERTRLAFREYGNPQAPIVPARSSQA